MQKLIILLIAAITTIAVNASQQRIHPDCIRSDVNDDSMVTQADVDTIIDYINNEIVLLCHQVLHADINRDGRVNGDDVTQLQSELSGLSEQGYPWGDINGDRIVDEIDFDKLEAYVYGQISSLPTLGYDTGDISGDGRVNYLDLDIFSACDKDYLVSPFRSSPY